MPHPIQESPLSSKAKNEDFKDIGVFGTFKFKMEHQNLEYECIEDQWPYPNQDQVAKS